jgi:hypothetical protein
MRLHAAPILITLGALMAAGCAPSVEEQAADARAVIDRYCFDCH